MNKSINNEVKFESFLSRNDKMRLLKVGQYYKENGLPSTSYRQSTSSFSKNNNCKIEIRTSITGKFFTVTKIK